MSQVRKLLKGQNIPKAENGYKFRLDSQDIYLTDEDLAEIDDRFAELPMEQRQFLSNTTNAIKTGNMSGSRSGNLIDTRALAGLNEKELDRLREQRGSFIESAIPQKTYYTKQAINAALNIIYSTWKKNHGNKTDGSKSSGKTKIDNSKISLDFNNGVLSSTAGENITARNRIRQIMEHIDAGDNSTYDASLWTNLDTIKSLLANNPKYTEDLWTRMGTAGYKPTDDDINFLRNFEITFGDSTSSGTGSSSTSASFRNPDGSVDPDKTDSKTGAKIVYRGNSKYGEDPNGFYTSSTLGDDKPYIIDERDWGLFGGLTGDFERLRNGVIYKRRFYSPEEIDALTGGDLYDRIQSLRGINAAGYSGREKWNNARQYVSWRGSDNDYNRFTYTPNDKENPMGLKYDWDFIPEGHNISFVDATNAFSGIGQGNSVLGVYDYDDASSRNFYGFTKPKYYVVDNNGNWNLLSDLSGYNNYVDFSAFDPNKYIVEKKWFGNELYEHIDTTYNKSTRSNMDVYRKKVGNGYEYYIDVNGVLRKISDSLYQSIKNKNSITNREVSKGQHREGLFQWKKDGGKINYITKLQGGNYVPPPLPLRSINEQNSTPVQTNDNFDVQTDPSYLFDENGKFLGLSSLPETDQMELGAALGDLVGTGVSFIGPWGDVAGSLIGVGSDVTYRLAEKRRDVPYWTRAKHFWTNVGLDALGLVPWAGTAARYEKLAKVINKIGKPAINVIGTGLTAAGLYNAKDAFVKFVTEGGQSLTSDEWMQLTGGLQALLNVGHGAARRASDARFAEAISRAKKSPEVTSTYTSKVKGADDVDIPVSLKNEEVDAIVRSDADAGTTLKQTLVENYGADKTKLDAIEDSKLLNQFGFGVTTGTKGENKGRVLHVYRSNGRNAVERGYNAVKDKAETEYSKWGFVSDLWNGSQKRQNYIDEAMRDVNNTGIRNIIDEGIQNETFGVGENFPGITDKMIRRAYARSQARIGGTSPNTTTVLGREQYEYQRPQRTSESNSNQQNSTQQKRNYVEELQNAQTRATLARQSGQTVFTEPTSTSSSNSASTVQSAMKKAYSAPTSTNRTADIAAKRADIARKNASKRAAANIKKLKESKDPMKTLQELSEQDAKDILATRESELIDAIEVSIQDMWDRGMFRSQDEVSYYRNNLLNLFKGISQHKKGGVIKAQSGMRFNWKPSPNVPFAPGYVSPTLIYTPSKDWDTYINKFKTNDQLISELSTPTPQEQAEIDSIFRDSLIKPEEVPDLGGGSTKPISDKTKWLIPGISTLGAISNLWQSKKYADEEKAKINDGRYSLQSQPIDLMAYYNPIFERRRQEVNQRRMSGLLATPTNDWTLYNAGLNQLQSQLDAQLGELTTQEAQDKFTRDQTNVQLRNQKFALDTNTANENARMDAYFDMTSHDPNLAKMMRNWQTKENFRMQMLNMINKDINTIYGYKQNKFNMDQSREFDSWLRSNYADEVKAYSELDYNQRMQYADLEDYIERTNPGAVEAIRAKKQLMQEQYLGWLYQNGTTFNYDWLRGRTSPETDAYKKGGALRGKTRYTMEPDERIWVDNNKAAHAAIAKLNESTIKMLLKALK